MPRETLQPVYLGDGLYASHTPSDYIALHNGDHRSEPVAYFEPSNLSSLVQYAEKAWGKGTVRKD